MNFDFYESVGNVEYIGFIEKLLLQQRRQKIRLLNNVARNTHGRVIKLSRPKNIITIILIV